MTQKLLIFQSLWAMERRHTDGFERTLDENIAMIRQAGFDGISAHYTNRRDVVLLNETLRGSGLKIEAVCFPRSVEDLRLPLELAAAFPVSHVNLQPDIRLRRVEACLPLLDGWMRLAEDAGIPVFIETHRDRMTTDLFFTLDLLDRRPELPLLADLSHFLVGRELPRPCQARPAECPCISWSRRLTRTGTDRNRLSAPPAMGRSLPAMVGVWFSPLAIPCRR